MGVSSSLNVVRLPEIEMADCKPEVEYISGTESDMTEIPRATKFCMDAELHGLRQDIVRGWSIPGRIIQFKMAVVNRKNL